jgi:hypothetical protein
MKKLALYAIVGLFSASTAAFAEPVKLTDAQMADVTAGHRGHGGLGRGGGNVFRQSATANPVAFNICFFCVNTTQVAIATASNTVLGAASFGRR